MLSAAEIKRREERVKLLASALSNLGSAFVVAGAVGPLVIVRLDLGVVAASLLSGLAFHLAARGVLHYVAQDPDPAQERAT
jgi:hypothetical protein